MGNKNYILCPVCSKKKLVGLHRKTCQRINREGWLYYYGQQLSISDFRRGRIELAEMVRREGQ